MITTEDLLQGFLANFGNLSIWIEDNFSTWTFKVLRYFDELGKWLGYFTEFESNRYDLSWYVNFSDNLFMHIEHENSQSRINETLSKLFFPPKAKALKRVGIVYCKRDMIDQIISKFRNQKIELDSDEDILLIIFGLFDPSDDEGYWKGTAIRKFKNKHDVRNSVFEFSITEDDNEILYCALETIKRKPRRKSKIKIEE